MRIEYLDGERLRRSLIAGCEFVQHRRAELNRINVFPVPDGDTGTNLALTASAISDGLRSLRDRSVAVVARQAADSAIMGARGNCGMILSHFLFRRKEDVPYIYIPQDKFYYISSTQNKKVFQLRKFQ